MPIFNVLTAVVELIEADSEQEAMAVLGHRLAAAGFEVLDDADHSGPLPDAFESESLDDATLAVVRAEASAHRNRVLR